MMTLTAFSFSLRHQRSLPQTAALCPALGDPKLSPWWTAASNPNSRRKLQVGQAGVVQSQYTPEPAQACKGPLPDYQSKRKFA
jgi:hypothetical protein